MGHITIIIDRKPPEGSALADEQADNDVTAHVEYRPSDAASEQEIAQDMRRLYRQVRNLGTDNS